MFSQCDCTHTQDKKVLVTVNVLNFLHMGSRNKICNHEKFTNQCECALLQILAYMHQKVATCFPQAFWLPSQ